MGRRVHRKARVQPIAPVGISRYAASIGFAVVRTAPVHENPVGARRSRRCRSAIRARAHKPRLWAVK